MPNIGNGGGGAEAILSIPDGRALIRSKIELGKPFMAARYGTSEGRTLFWYWQTQVDPMLKGKPFPKEIADQVCTCSGFFPNREEMLQRWAVLETEASRSVDVLGTMDFFGEEWCVSKLCPQATLMPASGITPDATGWTSFLKGKKVLVVHPFKDTIEKQYRTNREHIYSNPNVLPEFDLQCIQAVQTLADQEDERFRDWFEALDYMTEEIAKRDFDIALLGCGAYGFPLAARVKQMGKMAIHMGGSLQTLFGIKGSRWDTHKKVSNNYNEFWVYPSDAEKPRGAEKVENACYWKA